MRIFSVKTIPILFVVCATFLGCGGFHKISFYSPEPNQNISVQTGSRGPKEIARLPLNDSVEMYIGLFDADEGGRLRVFFDLPSGETIEFLDSTFEIIPIDGSPIRRAKIHSIIANYQENNTGKLKEFDPLDKLIGESYTTTNLIGSKSTFHSSFYIDINLAQPLPPNFELKIPQLKLSGKRIAFQTIRYNKKDGTFYQVGPW